MKRTLEEYLDNFEGNVMLLDSDLELLIEDIQTKEVTEDIVNEIMKILEEVSSIFYIHETTCECAPTLESCVNTLGTIQNVEALNEYKVGLISILTDIRNAISNFFIDRTNEDVYVFYHSIESNINTLVEQVNGSEDDDDDDDDYDFFS
jgi:hypothetical protein